MAISPSVYYAAGADKPHERSRKLEAPRLVCVVSHTHWDREWYHGAGFFAQRLVALIDALLSTPPETLRRSPFLLDGQAITLADYLSRKPESRDLLVAALRDRSIEAGPWFVLADNLIPSGEAIVRNLQAGRRVLERLGATPPLVAYCPDTFGHPAAMPMIAQGFGLKAGVVWRGAGGIGHPDTDAFIWSSPDGSTIPTCHLPPDGYEFGASLPTSEDGARQRWEKFELEFIRRNRTGVVLLLNGADHHARQPKLLNAVELLGNCAGTGFEIMPMSLSDWAEHFTSTLTNSSTNTSFNASANAVGIAVENSAHVSQVSGELRNSYGYTWTLGGTLATRAHQKRNNARLERLLLRDVEPWLALAVLHDKPGLLQRVSTAGEITMAQLPRLLSVAWEDLLSTHPHDTLCGCSTDAVSRRMESVHESVEEQSRGLRQEALKMVLHYDSVEARERRPAANGGAIVFRNRSARSRSGLALITVRTTVADVPVGPASAGAAREPKKAELSLSQFNQLLIQPLGKPELAWERRESPQHYPDNDLIAKQRMLAWVPEIPSLGIVAMNPHEIESSHQPEFVTATEKRGTFQLNNGLVSVSISRKGRVSISFGDRVVEDALFIETSRDAGDSYTPSPGSTARLSVSDVQLRESGPLRAAVEITCSVGSVELPGTPRGLVKAKLKVMVSAGSESVLCGVNIMNSRTNHRLRLVWRSDIVAVNDDNLEVIADAAFGPVRRPKIVAPEHSSERVVDGMPMHRWLMLSSSNKGAAVVSDGLAECFVKDGILGVTLLRAIGQLSLASIPERPGHAGWPCDIPDAQCQGFYRAKIGFLLTDAVNDGSAARLGQIGDDILLPLVGETWRDLDSSHGNISIRGPELVGRGLEMSAITISQNRPDAIVLRAFNCTDQAVDGSWLLPDEGPWLVAPTRMDETPLRDGHVCDNVIHMNVKPRSTHTCIVSRWVSSQ